MHKVMIVDDEALVITQLEERLTLMGYDVVGSASSGIEAIEMARHLSPDIVLMDIVMPGSLDGIEASKIIKTELDIPTIFVTAYTDDKFVERAKSVEPFGYIVKPFQEREIKAAIEIGGMAFTNN
jgi:YesN/AraC family two-component response regulator